MYIYLQYGATGGEGHGGLDVSGVGGHGAAVLQPQPVHVDAGHGGLVQLHRHPVGRARHVGNAWTHNTP